MSVTVSPRSRRELALIANVAAIDCSFLIQLYDIQYRIDRRADHFQLMHVVGIEAQRNQDWLTPRYDFESVRCGRHRLAERDEGICRLGTDHDRRATVLKGERLNGVGATRVELGMRVRSGQVIGLANSRHLLPPLLRLPHPLVRGVLVDLSEGHREPGLLPQPAGRMGLRACVGLGRLPRLGRLCTEGPRALYGTRNP